MSDNTTVCREREAPNPPPLIQNGVIHIQTHHIGFIVCGTFAIISTVVSAWLISKHLQWYTNKREQRYIVRLLFMVPIYAEISFASFYFWNQSTPIVLVRDSYEAIVLTAFFYLLLMYLSNNPEEQKRIFLKKGLSREADRIATRRGLAVQEWCFPLGFVKWKPSDGLYFLQLMKWGVLQYCIIRPTTTLAAVILNSVGLYCESSWNPRWGHPYIVIVMSISVTIAMYCLLQIYVVVSAELAPHKPLLKLVSVKAVVFLTFWQATFLSLLSMVGVIKDTEYMTAEDITIGIGAVIETFEMMLFSLLHIRAFTYKPYREIAIRAAQGCRPTPTSRWKSLGHAMDFRETFREIWTGCVYMFDKIRGNEPKPDFGARRIAHYEGAFGRSRVFQGQSQNSLLLRSAKHSDKKGKYEDPALPAMQIEIKREVSVMVEGHHQLLGLSKCDRYGLHPELEKSDGLEDQINRELQNQGDSTLTRDSISDSKPPVQNRLSWWYDLYDRLSQSGQEKDGRECESFIRLSKPFSPQSQHHFQHAGVTTRRAQNINVNRNVDIDDPPLSPLVRLVTLQRQHQPSLQRSPIGHVEDHNTGPVQEQGQGPPGLGFVRSQVLDHGLPLGNDYGHVHAQECIDRVNPLTDTPLRDGMIDRSHLHADLFGKDARAGPAQQQQQQHLHPQCNLHNFNFRGHDLPQTIPSNLHSRSLQKQRRVQGHGQETQTRFRVQDNPLRPSPSILPPAPKGALVILPSLSPHYHDTEPEFDPWQEHAQSDPLLAYPPYPYFYRYPNPGLSSKQSHPNHDHDHDYPPLLPPAVPPKDKPSVSIPRYVHPLGTTTADPRQKSAHRREPASCSPSPSSSSSSSSSPSPSPIPTPSSPALNNPRILLYGHDIHRATLQYLH